MLVILVILLSLVVLLALRTLINLRSVPKPGKHVNQNCLSLYLIRVDTVVLPLSPVNFLLPRP